MGTKDYFETIAIVSCLHCLEMYIVESGIEKKMKIKQTSEVVTHLRINYTSFFSTDLVLIAKIK